jgi:hypothetical protein
MDAESQEKSTGPATEPDSAVAVLSTSNVSKESGSDKADAAGASMFHHAGLEGSGIVFTATLTNPR